MWIRTQIRSRRLREVGEEARRQSGKMGEFMEVSHILRRLVEEKRGTGMGGQRKGEEREWKEKLKERGVGNV